MKMILTGLLAALGGYAWVETYVWIADPKHQAAMIFLSMLTVGVAACHRPTHAVTQD